MELVTLTSCWNVVEAEIIKSRLEQAGIPCILQGEASSITRVGAGFGNSSAEIPILVRAEDLSSAHKFLEDVA